MIGGTSYRFYRHAYLWFLITQFLTPNSWRICCSIWIICSLSRWNSSYMQEGIIIGYTSGPVTPGTNTPNDSGSALICREYSPWDFRGHVSWKLCFFSAICIQVCFTMRSATATHVGCAGNLFQDSLQKLSRKKLPVHVIFLLHLMFYNSWTFSMCKLFTGMISMFLYNNRILPISYFNFNIVVVITMYFLLFLSAYFEKPWCSCIKCTNQNWRQCLRCYLIYTLCTIRNRYYSCYFNKLRRKKRLKPNSLLCEDFLNYNSDQKF